MFCFDSVLYPLKHRTGFRCFWISFPSLILDSHSCLSLLNICLLLPLILTLTFWQKQKYLLPFYSQERLQEHIWGNTSKGWPFLPRFKEVSARTVVCSEEKNLFASQSSPWFAYSLSLEIVWYPFRGYFIRKWMKFTLQDSYLYLSLLQPCT